MICILGRLTLTLLCVTVTVRQAEGEYLFVSTVPATGVYLVALVIDPTSPDAEIHLAVNEKVVNIVAYGLNAAVGGHTVAMYLRQGDKVQSFVSGSMEPHGKTSMGVAYISDDDDDFIVYTSAGSRLSDQYVPFHYYLDVNVGWEAQDIETYISIEKEGLYWVSARPDCSHKWTTKLEVGPGLFTVICMSDAATLTSGAFVLESGYRLQLAYLYGDYLQEATTLSVGFLPHNSKDYLKTLDHVAFTGWVKQDTYYNNLEKIAFEGKVSTDYGNLYRANSRTFRIPVSGDYIIGVRGGPVAGQDLRIRMHVNSAWVFTSYSEHAMESGQDFVFTCHEGDDVYLLADSSNAVGDRTLVSIALLKKQD